MAMTKERQAEIALMMVRARFRSAGFPLSQLSRKSNELSNEISIQKEEAREFLTIVVSEITAEELMRLNSSK